MDTRPMEWSSNEEDVKRDDATGGKRRKWEGTGHTR